MDMMTTGALEVLAVEVLDQIVNAAIYAAEDTVRSSLAGRMSINEWANAAIEGVDRIKARIAEQGGLRFVGGKLRFAISMQRANYVNMSFQLYFLDQWQKWQKASAASEVPFAKFTYEAIDELHDRGEVVYEVN